MKIVRTYLLKFWHRLRNWLAVIIMILAMSMPLLKDYTTPFRNGMIVVIIMFIGIKLYDFKKESRFKIGKVTVLLGLSFGLPFLIFNWNIYHSLEMTLNRRLENNLESRVEVSINEIPHHVDGIEASHFVVTFLTDIEEVAEQDFPRFVAEILAETQIFFDEQQIEQWQISVRRGSSLTGASWLTCYGHWPGCHPQITYPRGEISGHAARYFNFPSVNNLILEDLVDLLEKNTIIDEWLADLNMEVFENVTVEMDFFQDPFEFHIGIRFTEVVNHRYFEEQVYYFLENELPIGLEDIFLTFTTHQQTLNEENLTYSISYVILDVTMPGNLRISVYEPHVGWSGLNGLEIGNISAVLENYIPFVERMERELRTAFNHDGVFVSFEDHRLRIQVDFPESAQFANFGQYAMEAEQLIQEILDVHNEPAQQVLVFLKLRGDVQYTYSIEFDNWILNRTLLNFTTGEGRTIGYEDVEIEEIQDIVDRWFIE